MPNFTNKLTENTQTIFAVNQFGLYAISITVRCRGSNDLKIEIDGRSFREVPPEKNVQTYDIPSAWNGSKLGGLKKTIVFLLKLDEGEHTISFVPRGWVTIEEWSYRFIENPSEIEFVIDQQAEDGDKRPWLTFVLVDLPLRSVTAEASVSWHLFDGDDVKLIIDNEVEVNPNSRFWRNWVWHAVPRQIFDGPRKNRKTVVKDLPLGLHYVELWADKTPTLHQVELNLGGFELKPESKRVPTESDPRWTENFADDPDQIILARALFGEARNTLVPDEARIAIGWVVKNRVASNRWSNTYWEVITKPAQFSAFNIGDSNRLYVEDPLHTGNQIDKKAWEHANKISGKIVSNELLDPTQGANHYYDDSISTPSWAKDHKPTFTATYINQYNKKASIFFYNL
ncbi:MAG: cell wall hydrolase [Patescibacteria group bacterium]|nr:cell wall hydrolase [Patescibacteria group bacterium]